MGSFNELLAQDPELSNLRAEYAHRPPSERRTAAEWSYDESLANSLFAAAVARIPGGDFSGPKWPPGFVALAIEPQYAPALLTVGAHEYRRGRKEEGMDLLLLLAQLPPDTEDWVEVIDEAAQFLVDAHDPDNAFKLYDAVLKVQPDRQEFIKGMGWALCRAGKQAEALPWMEKALANAPEDSSVLSDYGWALTELGRYEEAEPLLEKAVRLAPPNDPLPANNLKRLLDLKQNHRRKPKPEWSLCSRTGIAS